MIFPNPLRIDPMSVPLLHRQEASSLTGLSYHNHPKIQRQVQPVTSYMGRIDVPLLYEKKTTLSQPSIDLGRGIRHNRAFSPITIHHERRSPQVDLHLVACIAPSPYFTHTNHPHSNSPLIVLSSEYRCLIFSH